MSTALTRLPYDAAIVGSGAAGMTTALALAPLRVALITKTPGLPGGSSPYAQGGVAASMTPDDSPSLHAEDTFRVGAGLNEREMVALLTHEGPERLRELIELGVPFDRDAAGALSPQKEAAHSRNRIFHAHGDATGRAIVATLAHAVAAAEHIDVFTETFAWDLDVRGERTAGVLAWKAGDGWLWFPAGRVALATGGVGQLFSLTTNPNESTGDGVAMALRAGAVCADMELIQFHPTALAGAKGPDGSVGLLTEALRGAGARLINGRGERFMTGLHPDAELAPRDVVARGVWAQLEGGETVFLDACEAVGQAFPERFPTVYRLCREAGVDPRVEPIPAAPAAHYLMGGVLTDQDGRASLPGLWVSGEMACTGVHGANRLASNSLLECLVFGRRVADNIKAASAEPARLAAPKFVAPPRRAEGAPDSRQKLQDIMYRGAGLVRDGAGMRQALTELAALQPQAGDVRAQGEFRNLRLVGEAVLKAALTRTESRGAHFRPDFPETNPAWARHILTRLDPAGAVVAAPAAKPIEGEGKG